MVTMVTIAGRYPNLQRCFANLVVAIGENLAPRSQFVEGSMSDQHDGMPSNMGILEPPKTDPNRFHIAEVVISLVWGFVTLVI